MKKPTSVKILTSVIIAILTITSFTLLSSCSERKMIGISIRANSFLDAYEIDTDYDAILPGAYLVATYSDGESEEVKITKDMIIGFDTKTTGNKTMYAEYKGFRSEDVKYTVYNPENLSRNVLTTARMSVRVYDNAVAMEYTISLSKGDLSIVRAIQFTLESENSLSVTENQSNLYVLIGQQKLSYYTSLVSDKKLKAVVYTENGASIDNGTVIKFKIDNSINAKVKLSEITVSDGQNDYYLPVAKWE